MIAVARQFFRILSRPGELLLKKFPPVSIFLGAIGLTVGLFIAFLISLPIMRFGEDKGVILVLIVYTILGLLGIQIAIGSGNEIVKFLKKDLVSSTPEGIPLVDSSIIIDGRIEGVVKTGVFEKLAVPTIILGELQLLADSTDPKKKASGRRGLEILNKLMEAGVVEILDARLERGEKTDAGLLRLAQERRRPILTTDFNLEQIGKLQGIKVLNLNELANVLRPPIYPGDELKVFIAREGTHPDQGVGFLEDGTMVVVERGKKLINQEVEVTVMRILHTQAGRVVFASRKDANHSS